MYSKKRMMALAITATVVGSVVGALGESLPLLVLARALQGVGMPIVPVGIAIMRDELPRDRVRLGVALMSATLAIGAEAGSPAAGLSFEQLDWYATGPPTYVRMITACALRQIRRRWASAAGKNEPVQVVGILTFAFPTPGREDFGAPVHLGGARRRSQLGSSTSP